MACTPSESSFITGDGQHLCPETASLVGTHNVGWSPATVSDSDADLSAVNNGEHRNARGKRTRITEPQDPRNGRLCGSVNGHTLRRRGSLRHPARVAEGADTSLSLFERPVPQVYLADRFATGLWARASGPQAGVGTTTKQSSYDHSPLASVTAAVRLSNLPAGTSTSNAAWNGARLTLQMDITCTRVRDAAAEGTLRNTSSTTIECEAPQCGHVSIWTCRFSIDMQSDQFSGGGHRKIPSIPAFTPCMRPPHGLSRSDELV